MEKMVLPVWCNDDALSAGVFAFGMAQMKRFRVRL
jgi:hypothetical protein